MIIRIWGPTGIPSSTNFPIRATTYTLDVMYYGLLRNRCILL